MKLKTNNYYGMLRLINKKKIINILLINSKLTRIIYKRKNNRFSHLINKCKKKQNSIKIKYNTLTNKYNDIKSFLKSKIKS